MIASEIDLQAPCDRLAEHRARRGRQAWRTARAGFASKIVAVLARCITIPLSLQVLGPERYGLWLAAGSVISWLGISDFGFASGLVNAVGHDFGRGDWPAIRRHVSTAFFGFAALSVLIAAAVLCAAQWPGIPRLLGVAGRSALAADARALLLICGLFFAASFSLNAVGPLCSALQEGYFGAYVQIAGSILSIALVFALTLGRVTIAGFAIVMSAPALVSSCALAAYVLLVRHRTLRPALRFCSIASAKTIAAYGTPLLAVQLGDLAILYSTNVLIASRLGPAQVPAYSIPAAAFLIAGTACYGLASPYLAAYAEARGRNDWEWIRTAAFRILGITCGLMLLAGFAMVLAGTFAVSLWTAGRVVPGRQLLFAMSLYYLLMACSAANGILLAGIGRVKTKALLHLVVATVFVAGSWVLMPTLGILALPVAGSAGYLVDAAVALPCALRHIARRA
jgi:O-antigen/teichoic acid export membrane protein